jgi:hypothetical protein
VHVSEQVVVEVNVTDWPMFDGFGLEPRVVVVWIASVKVALAVVPEDPVAVTL